MPGVGGDCVSQCCKKNRWYVLYSKRKPLSVAVKLSDNLRKNHRLAFSNCPGIINTRARTLYLSKVVLIFPLKLVPIFCYHFPLPLPAFIASFLFAWRLKWHCGQILHDTCWKATPHKHLKSLKLSTSILHAAVELKRRKYNCAGCKNGLISGR